MVWPWLGGEAEVQYASFGGISGPSGSLLMPAAGLRINPFPNLDWGSYSFSAHAGEAFTGGIDRFGFDVAAGIVGQPCGPAGVRAARCKNGHALVLLRQHKLGMEIWFVGFLITANSARLDERYVFESLSLSGHLDRLWIDRYGCPSRLQVFFHTLKEAQLLIEKRSADRKLRGFSL